MRLLPWLLAAAALPVAAQMRVTSVAGGFQPDNIPADRIWFTPQDLASDRAGNLYVADLQSVYRITPESVTTTIAGAGPYGPSDATVAKLAALDTISGIAVDSAGTVLYIAEGARNRISRVDLASGALATVRTPGVELRRPGSLAIDSQGNLLIADQGNYVVRRLNVSTGESVVLAGSNEAGGGGDGGPAILARLSPVFGIALDDAGNLLIADTQNRRVRRVDASGRISTVAIGELGFPARVRVDSQGRYLIADASGQRVLIHDPRIRINTGFFGFLFPIAVLEDSTGRVVVADQVANRLIRIDPQLSQYEWFAGTAPDGDGGPAEQSRLSTPLTVAAAPDGDVYFTDELAHKVRAYSPSSRQIGTLIGQGAPGAITLPKAMTVDRKGDLYVLDGGGNRILRRRSGQKDFEIFADRVRPGDGIASDGEGHVYYSFQYAIYRITEGERQERIAGAELFEGAVGLAVDSAGNLYVAERDANRIRKIEAGSGNVSIFASDLQGPAGIAFDADGTLHVAESRGARITSIRPGGERTSFTGPFQFPAYVAAANGAIYFTDLRDTRLFKAELQ